MLTNVDGTTQLLTLTQAQAFIAAVKLVPDDSKVALPDGSTIDGQTTFTRVNGISDIAATVLPMNEADGHILVHAVTRNANGSGVETLNNRCAATVQAFRQRVSLAKSMLSQILIVIYQQIIKRFSYFHQDKLMRSFAIYILQKDCLDNLRPCNISCQERYYCPTTGTALLSD